MEKFFNIKCRYSGELNLVDRPCLLESPIVQGCNIRNFNRKVIVSTPNEEHSHFSRDSVESCLSEIVVGRSLIRLLVRSTRIFPEIYRIMRFQTSDQKIISSTPSLENSAFARVFPNHAHPN